MNDSILSRIKKNILENQNNKNKEFSTIGILEKVHWEEMPLHHSFDIIFNFKTLDGKLVKLKETITSKVIKSKEEFHFKFQSSSLFIFKQKELDNLFKKNEFDIEYSIKRDVLEELKTKIFLKSNNNLKEEIKKNRLSNEFGRNINDFNNMRFLIREYVKYIHENYLGYLTLIGYEDNSFMNSNNANIQYTKKYSISLLNVRSDNYGLNSNLKTNIDDFKKLLENKLDKIKILIHNLTNNIVKFSLVNKKVWVYDIEVFKKFFGVVFREFDFENFTYTENVKEFKSIDKNYLVNLCEFLDNIHILVGFNNFFYDDIIMGNLIINYLENKKDIANEYINYNGEDGVSFLFAMSNEKINNGSFELLKDIKNEKGYVIYNNPKIFSLDLKTGLAPNVSLKEIEANLGEDIEESSVPFDKSGDLNNDEIKDIMKYCNHDVLMSCKTLMQKQRRDEFVGIMQLVETFNLDESFIRRTKATITTEILKCLGKLKGLDDFNFTYTKYINDLFTYDLDYFLKDKNLDKYKDKKDIENDNKLNKNEKEKLLHKFNGKKQILYNYFGIIDDKNIFENPLTNYNELNIKWNVMRGIISFFDEIKEDGNNFSQLLYSRNKHLSINDIIVNSENIVDLLDKYKLLSNKDLIKKLESLSNELEIIDKNIDGNTKKNRDYFINIFRDYLFSVEYMNGKNKNNLMIKTLYDIYDIFATTLSNKHIKVIIDGNEVKIAFGGLHCALENIYYNNTMFSVDVASYYPSLMDKYNYFTRSSINGNEDFVNIKEQRLIMKRAGNPLQQVYKIAINSTYGVQKASTSRAFDPVQANNICINGQIGLVDLIMRLSSFSKMIQANTDGVVVAFKTTRDGNGKLYEDGNFYKQKTKLETMYNSWELSYDLELELDIFNKIKQTNVNNYIVSYDKKEKDGSVTTKTKEKGAGFGNNKINEIVFDKNQLRIIRIFEKESFLNDKNPYDVIDDILNSNNIDLTMFQILAKTSKAYPELRFINYLGENIPIKTKVNRIFPIKTNLIDGKVQVLDNEKPCGLLERIKFVDKNNYIENLENNLKEINVELEKENLKDAKIEKLNIEKNKLEIEIENKKKMSDKNFYVTSKVTNASDYSFILNSKCKNMLKEEVLKLNLDFDYYVDIFKKNQMENNYKLINTYQGLIKHIGEINKLGLWYIKESDVVVDNIKLITKRVKEYVKMESFVNKENEYIKECKATHLKKLNNIKNVDEIQSFINRLESIKDINIYLKNEFLENEEFKNYNNVKINNPHNTDLFNALISKKGNILKFIGILKDYLYLIKEIEKKDFKASVLKSLIKECELNVIKQSDITFDKELFENLLFKKTKNLSKLFIVSSINKEMDLINNNLLYLLFKNKENENFKEMIENIFAKMVFYIKMSDENLINLFNENNNKLREILANN